MLERPNPEIPIRVLVVDPDLALPGTAGARAALAIVDALKAHAVQVTEARSVEDGLAVIRSDAALHCHFINWTDGADRLLHAIREQNDRVPVFLMGERSDAEELPVDLMRMVDEFVWKYEDTADFIGERGLAAISRFFDAEIPPFFRAILDYNKTHEYSWAAPGHQGGVAFTKTVVGRLFYDFYGENLFRTDTGIERGALGSLLDHTGPVAQSERLTAQVFGSHRSYSVLNGTSGSNRSVFNAMVADDEIAVCDRNCHKSIEQGLVQSGSIPVFYVPTRNRYGIIGPIPPEEFEPAAIEARIAANPLAKGAASQKPVYTVVTNCTYDGMCYDAERAQTLLGQSFDTVHFDEAWYGYARFNPMYVRRFAMRGDPADHPADGPTVFATQSSHKLLAALSQSSFIHVRQGRRKVEHARFNESYCAQATTSPLYAIVAGNDVCTAMMDGRGGPMLTQQVINEAVDFRLALARYKRELAAAGEWFFGPWNAGEVTAPDGKRVPFHAASREQLTTDPNCWVLHPGEIWHGFESISPGWCMLDPVKAGILCPGMQDDGTLAPEGIPAAIVSAYLGRDAIVPTRTTDHMVLVLFSVGITKGKWGTLVSSLLDFKRDYDANAPLERILPNLVALAPSRYGAMGLRDLGNEMWQYMRKSAQGKWAAASYANLPTPVMKPRDAFNRLMKNQAKSLPVEELAGKVSGVGVIPYPPGIPVVMPGESFGPADGPWINYIRSLEAWGQTFPGFEAELEGADVRNGRYFIDCLD